MNRAAENRTVVLKLLVLTLVMFGFGYALVPLYKKICEVTGVNLLGRPSASPVNTQVDTGRWLTLEFDANLRSDLPWQFRPLRASVRVHPGELVQVMFEVRNNSDRMIAGQAIPSYGPQVAGQYVRKLECFCFAQQRFAPGEVRQMPVVLAIEPGLPKDVNTVTLSYTFFEREGVLPAVAAPRRAGLPPG